MKTQTPTPAKPAARGNPRGVFHDLFDEEEAVELAMRAELLRGLQEWLQRSGLSQAAAASQLSLTQARVSEISRGKISRFSLEKLVRLAARSGLRPALSLAA